MKCVLYCSNVWLELKLSFFDHKLYIPKKERKVLNYYFLFETEMVFEICQKKNQISNIKFTIYVVLMNVSN